VRTQALANALKSAPAEMKRARESRYDPKPDLMRLERGVGTPVMGHPNARQRISIMLRRDADFDRVVDCFRQAALLFRARRPYALHP
jgi:hypothetical protein